VRIRSWVNGAIATVLLSTIAVAGVIVYRAHQVPATQYATAELPSLDGQGTIRLAALRGHPLVVNFFASWCPACAAEMPAFDRVYRDSGGKLDVVGVDEQDMPADGLDLARHVGVSYPLAFDRGNRLYKQLHGEGMPITAFYRSDGSLAQVYDGALDGGLLDQIVRTLS